MANDKPYLFPKVKAEIDKETTLFESIINDPNSLVIFIVTTTDEKMVSFYKYLKRVKKQLEYKHEDADSARLSKINHILESISEDKAVKAEVEREKEEEKNQIAQIMNNLERKKVEKMGPIRKFIYKRQKREE
jgi:hypothetical protein